MQALDLRAFALRLPPESRRLKGLIGQVADLNSARVDVRLAADMASRAVDLFNEGRELDGRDRDILLALHSSAVIYYVRSVKSHSDHRRTFDIRPHLDARELRSHELFCRLRDDAIAHFGPGELEEGPALRSDHLFVARTGNIATVSRTLYGSDELARRLAAHSQRVSHIMQRLFHEKEAELVAALNAVAGDEEMIALADASRVELEDALGDETVAHHVHRGPRGHTHFRIG